MKIQNTKQGEKPIVLKLKLTYKLGMQTVIQYFFSRLTYVIVHRYHVTPQLISSLKIIKSINESIIKVHLVFFAIIIESCERIYYDL